MGSFARRAKCWQWPMAPSAYQLLDFYHASQHLWSLGQALHPKDEAMRRAWVEERLHRLRHGQQQEVLREIAALPRRRGQVGKLIRREQNYFAEQAGRMNYQKWARQGWPIGSGAVESQCRRKRPGQFGLPRACGIWTLWKKLATMVTGMNSGRPCNPGGSGEMRPFVAIVRKVAGSFVRFLRGSLLYHVVAALQVGICFGGVFGFWT